MPWSFIRIAIAFLVGAPVSIYLGAALQNGPDAADLHLCELLRRFNPTVSNHCVPAIWDSSGVIIACIVLLVCLIVVALELRSGLTPLVSQQTAVVAKAFNTLDSASLQWLRESHVGGRPESDSIGQALYKAKLVDRDYVGWTEVKSDLKPIISRKLRSIDAKWKILFNRAAKKVDPYFIPIGIAVIIIGAVFVGIGIYKQSTTAENLRTELNATKIKLGEAQTVNVGQKVTVDTSVVRAPSPEIVANIKAPLLAEIDSLKLKLAQQPKTTAPTDEPKPAVPERKYTRTEANEIVDALNETQNTVSALEAALSRHNWNLSQASNMTSGGPGFGQPPAKVRMQQMLDRIQELFAANQKTEKELVQILKKYSAHQSDLKEFAEITMEPDDYRNSSSELRDLITIALTLEPSDTGRLASVFEPAARRYVAAGLKRMNQVNDLLKKIERQKTKIRESL